MDAQSRCARLNQALANARSDAGAKMSFAFNPSQDGFAEMTVLWFVGDEQTPENAMCFEVPLGPVDVDPSRFDAFCEGLRRASGALAEDWLHEGMPPALHLIEQPTLRTADDFGRVLSDPALRRSVGAEVNIRHLQQQDASLKAAPFPTPVECVYLDALLGAQGNPENELLALLPESERLWPYLLAIFEAWSKRLRASFIPEAAPCAPQKAAGYDDWERAGMSMSKYLFEKAHMTLAACSAIPRQRLQAIAEVLTTAKSMNE